MLEFVSILTVGLLGGALPLLFKWSDRQFHAALALASGVFLGAVFLHLLPMVGAVAGTAHADLIWGPNFGGDAPGQAAMHDHNGDGVPDHLASQHQGAPSDPGAAAQDAAQGAAQGAAPQAGTASGSGAAAAGHGHSHGSSSVWLWVLLGVVGVYFVEALIVPGRHNHPHQAGCGAGPGGHEHAGHEHAGHEHVGHEHAGHEHAELGHHGRGHDHGHGQHGHSEPAPRPAPSRESQRHRAVGWAALVGLTVHSLTSGVALAAVAENQAIASVMLWAILAHKGFESFSLASVFSMSSPDPRRVLAMVIAFSFVTPLGLLLGHQVTALFGTGGIAVLTALAAGTFLYVCIGELLPEVFHHREDVFLKIGLLCAGVTIMYLVHEVGGA
ncbi:MAG: ZIP family metal transporter [Planctomycetota bacterium]